MGLPTVNALPSVLPWYLVLLRKAICAGVSALFLWLAARFPGLELPDVAGTVDWVLAAFVTFGGGRVLDLAWQYLLSKVPGLRALSGR